jgi:hypothetical protein
MLYTNKTSSSDYLGNQNVDALQQLAHTLSCCLQHFCSASRMMIYA